MTEPSRDVEIYILAAAVAAAVDGLRDPLLRFAAALDRLADALESHIEGDA